MIRDPRSGALIAVGLKGLILRSQDAGVSWQRIASGTQENLRQPLIDQKTGAIFVPGRGGSILRSDDGGRSWRPLPTQTRKSLKTLLLHSRTGSLIATGERIVRLSRLD